jgi:predicted NAD/FAD-binding protein
LNRECYGREFIEHYLIPMTAAIWSARAENVVAMPARFLIAFFQNHGLLQIWNRPRWRTIPGGARRYVQAIAQTLRERLQLKNPVRSIRRDADYVEVNSARAPKERFDCVILACHADQALRILEDASAEERAILGHFSYQKNRAILHTDSTLLPQNRRAWASWNYRIPRDHDRPVAVTYDLNRLQSLGAARPICLTLNDQDRIDPDCVLRELEFEHPAFGPGTLRAQQRHEEINGTRHTYYCGAYWGYGFHEDGVRSALTVCRSFGKTMEPCTAVSTGDSSGIGVSNP